MTVNTSGLRRETLNEFDPKTGEKGRAIDVAAHAGTAFDGRHLFQLSGDRIQKIDPKTGRVLSTIPAPGGAGSGLAWAEGTLWRVNIATEKSIKSIPIPGRCFAPSNPTASSPESPGSTASSGTPRPKATRAIYDTSTLKLGRFWRN